MKLTTLVTVLELVCYAMLAAGCFVASVIFMSSWDADPFF